MFNKTSNPYQFKYLVTGLSGKGLKEVYLPPVPPEEEILFKEENKWTRMPLPADWKKWEMEEYLSEQKANDKFKESREPDDLYWEPNPHKERFIAREFKRRKQGIFFWSNGIITHLTGEYYWYLQWWEPDFGHPDFRESDKELWYFLKYSEEDDCSFGTAYNTLRRGGKSAQMGCWGAEYVTRSRRVLCGIQGEKREKAYEFFDECIIRPFRRLPKFWQPVYDTTTTQKNEIKFFAPPTRGGIFNPFDNDSGPLESTINFKEAGVHAYDRAKLQRYLVEEPAKTIECDVADRWDVVKVCSQLGKKIIGKSLWGTTSDEVGYIAGERYQKFVYNSDFNKKGEDGRTKTGLYAIFMPADCALEGGFDEFGHPDRKGNKEWIIRDRQKYKDDPRQLANLIRKFPLSWEEFFWISADDCLFNGQILQTRQMEVLLDDTLVRMGDLEPEIDNDGILRYIWMPNQVSGRFKACWLPKTFEETNRIEVLGKMSNGNTRYRPKNGTKIRVGFDPIQQGKTSYGQPSKPVALAKLLYDPLIDGILTSELMRERAKEKFPYQTNKDIMLYDYRPDDPNELYEDICKMIHFLGCPIHVEKQKAAFIDYARDHGYEEFIQSKFRLDHQKPTSADDFGTHATAEIIDTYIDYVAIDVAYFGHTYCFLEVIHDLLMARRNKLKEHDYLVAKGYVEMSLKMPDNFEDLEYLDLDDILPRFDNSENTSIQIG